MTPTETESRPSEILISVIIPCYNSSRTIRRCLDAILNQQTNIRFDVTVVDSSEDETSRIVSEEFPSVKLVKLNTRTFAGPARNIGVESTTGKYCLMIDSDCIADPELIERIASRLAEGKWTAVGGAICNGTPESWSGLLCYLLEFKEFLPVTEERVVTGLPTANIAYDRAKFKSYGGFDPRMQFAEDILFNWQLSSAGERILFDPKAKITHLNRTGWMNVLGYQWGMGQMSARARRIGGLPGSNVLKFPPLILLLPFARSYRAARWLLTYDRKLLLKFLLMSPMYFLACSIWAAGFLKEALSGRSNEVLIASHTE